MKNYMLYGLIIFISCFFVSEIDATTEPITKDPVKITAKVKKGNKIGETTVTMNLVFVTITRKVINCDKMENRICYEKKGEPTSGGGPETHSFTTNDGVFGGTIISESEVDLGTYIETTIDFNAGSYFSTY